MGERVELGFYLFLGLWPVTKGVGVKREGGGERERVTETDTERQGHRLID